MLRFANWRLASVLALVAAAVLVILPSFMPTQAVEALAAPSLGVATMTVTEKGYCLIPASGALDMSNPRLRADLDGAALADTREKALQIARLGHAVFRRLGELPVPSFCFMNGVALGGVVASRRPGLGSCRCAPSRTPRTPAW